MAQILNHAIIHFLFSICVVHSQSMDEISAQKIKERLGTKTLERTGYVASGCISHGEKYTTDFGSVFIKRNSNPYAKVMFESEIASLTALEKTNTIRVPHPIALVEGSRNMYYCILEYLPINRLRYRNTEFGEKLADLHLHNQQVAKGTTDYVDKFGFNITTCIGLLPSDNTWRDDWPTFFTFKLDEQVQRIMKKEPHVHLQKLWIELKTLIPRFFENIKVEPSLLHGDLWEGNLGETETEPIIFDPGCFYGHNEFDLAMTSMYGSLHPEVYKAYHERFPKVPGFNDRVHLYHLFYYLNHWNHFGASYSTQSLSTMKHLIRTKFPLV